MATLLVGTRYNYEHEISPYVFPFTPIELHAGYLLGRERIIATHSGNYGWAGERCLVQVRHFSKDGKLTGKDFTTTVGKESRTAVELAESEAVVLERLPILVRPKSGTAEISALRCGADKLAWTLRAPAGATMRVSSGAMKLTPRQRFAVTIGSETREITASRDATLSFDIKSNEPVQVLVCPSQ